VTFVVHNGDCREVMASMDAESVDAVVCDPPYGLSFMGKGWDHGVPGVEFWTEAMRVAKPGAHLLAFGGTRTYHRLACAIEDAGWEIRDCVMWVYGSGFPKSHDVSKAIDKAAGAEREVIGVSSVTGERRNAGSEKYGCGNGIPQSVNLITAPATDAARQWSGWGTALKPAWEPIIVARKPLCGTVAENVLTHGAGGINVDGCRIGTESTTTIRSGNSGANGRYGKDDRVFTRENPPGRWPANVIHDGSDEVKSLTGSAARFFYCAKASKADRDEGCEGLESRTVGVWGGEEDDLTEGKKRVLPANNHHPTVKPTALMRYLCRLVTPPGGVALDPFTGSGSTGKAAVLEGFDFVGIEREAEYVEIARARIAAAAGQRPLLEATA
jgi:site-specific DNA-methyltransferase (adenine-specific)